MYLFVSDTKLELRYMRVTSLTPLQEDIVESFVGWPKAYVHKETGVLTEDQDAISFSKTRHFARKAEPWRR